MKERPIGLTGGIATGKSLVCDQFRSAGFVTISGDDIAREVMVAGSPVLDDLARVFGKQVLTETGALNRRVMLNLLLDDPAKMTTQLKVLAPHLLPVIDARVRQAMRSNPISPVMVEAPLLFEYDQAERYCPIIVVTVPRRIQIQRLMERSGQKREWAEAVIDLQWPMARKEALADYVIDNSGTVAETTVQVQGLAQKLRMV